MPPPGGSTVTRSRSHDSSVLLQPSQTAKSASKSVPLAAPSSPPSSCGECHLILTISQWWKYFQSLELTRTWHQYEFLKRERVWCCASYIYDPRLYFVTWSTPATNNNIHITCGEGHGLKQLHRVKIKYFQNKLMSSLGDNYFTIFVLKVARPVKIDLDTDRLWQK